MTSHFTVFPYRVAQRLRVLQDFARALRVIRNPFVTIGITLLTVVMLCKVMEGKSLRSQLHTQQLKLVRH